MIKMKKILIITFACLLVASNLYAAGTNVFGTKDLASDSTAVTGTNATQAVTPASLSARLKAPGAIGGTTASTGAFTTITASTPRPTAGSGTGITVNDPGSIRTEVYKVTVAKTNFVTAGVTHDVTLATLPAKSIVHAVIADVTEAFACTGVCTTATLSATVGISAGGVEFLASFDLDAAAAAFGDTDAEVGSKLSVAGDSNSGYISWAGTPVIMRATSGTGNWGSGTATNLSLGSVTVYILYSILP
jgi:hypothetical protein